MVGPEISVVEVSVVEVSVVGSVVEVSIVEICVVEVSVVEVQREIREESIKQLEKRIRSTKKKQHLIGQNFTRHRLFYIYSDRRT